jgi:polyisoprenoid-binding protein YceI
LSKALKTIDQMMFRLLTIFLLFTATTTVAQKYVSEKSNITFFSEAPLENITAKNTKGTGLISFPAQEFAFSVPIKEFQFAKSLMQEHFNEKYMESEKFPKATFAGKINGFDTKSAQEQKVVAAGKLTIHGVTRDVEIPGSIRKTGNSYTVAAKFPVKLVDHKIKVPELMWQKIAEQIDVTVEFSMRPQ